MSNNKTNHSEDMEFTLYEAACLIFRTTPEEAKRLSEKDKYYLEKRYTSLKEFAASERYRGQTNYHELMEKLLEISLHQYLPPDELIRVCHALNEARGIKDSYDTLLRSMEKENNTYMEGQFKKSKLFWKNVKIKKSILNVYALTRFIEIDYTQFKREEEQNQTSVAMDKYGNRYEKIFQPSEDYCSITLNGHQTFTLTPNQAIAIQMLHEAFISGNPDVFDMHILDRIGTTNIRLRDTFRSSPEVWKALIISKKKGTHRLNLPQITQIP